MSKTPNLSAPSLERIAVTGIQERYRTLRTAIKAGAFVGAVYFGQGAVEAITGETTRLAIELSILADIKFAATLTLAGLTTTWAVVERVIRHRKVEQMSGRIEELETRLDPNRSSSGLTPKGKTHPKDKTP